MTAVSTKDVSIYFTKTKGTALTCTAPTGTANSPISVPCSSGSGAAYDVVQFRGTGWNKVDNSCVAAAEFSDAAITLLGLENTYQGEASDPTKAVVYGSSDWIKLCLSELTINSADPNTVSVATYCNPTAVMESAVQESGTFGFGGFMNVCDDDYPVLYRLCADQEEVVIKIDLGNNGDCQQGWLIAEGVCSSSMQWSLPIDGAIEYSGQVILQNKFRHFWPEMPLVR
jgi:hypothetical protein